MILFCNEQKCKKSICTLCLKEHNGHSIVDLKEKQKDAISAQIKLITGELQTYRDEISMAREDVQKTV